ncbi:MAG: ABC transporter permease [Proteobacteria bacterium]|nr:ABC transporter permease [Pseudomonadota bacterium]
MSYRKQVLDIACWEFLHFFKLRDLIISIVLVGGVSLAIAGFSYWQERSRPVIELAVISPIELALDSEHFDVKAHGPTQKDQLEAAVARGELAGLLVVTPPRATLLAPREPLWLDEISAAVTAAVQNFQLDRLGIDRAQLEVAMAPVAIAVELVGGQTTHSDDSITLSMILTGLMLVMLITGIGYLFVGVTGEKQQRVAEQIFSITSAQALIDGKIVGIAAVSMLSTLQLGAIGLVVYELVKGGALGWALNLFSAVDFGQLVVLAAFAAVGFAFWFVVCAALFATIDDPHSSARNNAIALPMLAPAAVFLGMSSPDSVMMQVLSWLPITSMTVMPARVVLSEVAVWQIVLSLAVSIAAIAFVRRAAGRLYEAGMLMYGKEPSLAEMLHWMRSGHADRRA